MDLRFFILADKKFKKTLDLNPASKLIISINETPPQGECNERNQSTQVFNLYPFRRCHRRAVSCRQRVGDGTCPNEHVRRHGGNERHGRYAQHDRQWRCLIAAGCSATRPTFGQTCHFDKQQPNCRTVQSPTGGSRAKNRIGAGQTDHFFHLQQPFAGAAN